nr:retrotransposon protein, putative, Ty1-copia subclass [Tanacetum cinerariifolium]
STAYSTAYFWGYALETAARILNMVPIKKVDRTPYEIWHGKAPKYQPGEGYHAVPPPYTGTFMPPKPDLVFHDAPNVNEIVHVKPA